MLYIAAQIDVIFIFFSYRCVGRDGHQTSVRVLRPKCWMQLESRLAIFIIRVNFIFFFSLKSMLSLKASATVRFDTEEERRHIVGGKRGGIILLLLNKQKNSLTFKNRASYI